MQACKQLDFVSRFTTELALQGERVYAEKVPKETMTLDVCFEEF